MNGDRYVCLVGHEIQPARLADETEVQTLDEGAEVRLCRLHGAPVAVVRNDESKKADRESAQPPGV